MKEKKDCKECGIPLKDWQVKQGYDMCLDCYNSKKRKSSHEILKEDAIKEEDDKEVKEEMKEEELVEEDLGENNGHLEDDEQGKE